MVFTSLACREKSRWKTEPKADQVFAVVRTDDQGRIRYRAGFGWKGDGATPSQQAWLDSLDNARQAGGN